MNVEDEVYCRKAFLDLMFIPVGFLFGYVSQNIIAIGLDDGLFLSMHFDSAHLFKENIIAVLWFWMSFHAISVHRKRIESMEQVDQMPLAFTDMESVPPENMIASAVVSIIGMFLLPLILYSESHEAFALILMIIGRLWFMSTDLVYMNPVLWLFGYRFFYADTMAGKRLLIMNGSIASGELTKAVPLSENAIYIRR